MQRGWPRSLINLSHRLAILFRLLAALYLLHSSVRSNYPVSSLGHWANEITLKWQCRVRSGSSPHFVGCQIVKYCDIYLQCRSQISVVVPF